MRNIPDNTQDIIDNRDVIARIEELRGDRAAHNDGEPEDWASVYPEDAEELATLEALAEQVEDYASDWGDDARLIRDSYFQEYAQELAFDTGAITETAQWPNRHIDWAEAARELQQGYTSVYFAGVTYWIR